MNTIVLGGTSVIGCPLVTTSPERGHHAVAAIPATGVDAVTGEGASQLLPGPRAMVRSSLPPTGRQRMSTAEDADESEREREPVPPHAFI